jgi:hypothetical protein
MLGQSGLLLCVSVPLQQLPVGHAVHTVYVLLDNRLALWNSR